MAEKPKVRCADCGFLSLRRHDTRELVAFEEQWRESGQYVTGSPFGGPPICLCQVISFKPPKHPPDQVYASKLILAERTCDDFMKWLPGSSPKEHRQMRFSAETVKLAKEERDATRLFQEEVRKSDRKWQEDRRCEDVAHRQKQEEQWKEEALHRKQETDDRKKELGYQKHQLLIVGIIGTFVLATAQIVGALIQSNQSPPVVNIVIPDKK